MKIICFGDSITRGYDVREGLGWVELCSAALPAYHMENHGIDGLSVQGLINYLESWCIDKSYEDDRYICIMCDTVPDHYRSTSAQCHGSNCKG